MSYNLTLAETESYLRTVIGVLADDQRRRAMGRALRELARPAAAASVADLIEEVAV